MLALKMEGAMRRNPDSLREAENDPPQMGSKELGILDNSHSKWIPPATGMSLEVNSSPELPDKPSARAHHDFSLVTPWV